MIERGEIYFVDLDPSRGREQAGKRPVLVLSSDWINRLPLVVTVVAGTKGANVSKDYPSNVRLSPVETGLAIETVFICFQIRSVDPSRFPSKPAGRVSYESMRAIEKAVRTCLEL
ncbi:MAG: type II toxin-antitoxin system PemK/MazF family toxin [Pyrinomonadaceae bacterium]